MCCFNRRMPIINNCILVAPAASNCGGPAVSCATPPVVPNCALDPNQVAAARTAAVARANVVCGQCQDLWDSQAEVVVEPAMVTAPNIINHHRRIEHIVPVITENIHQHHAHHEFVARPESRFRQTFDANVSVGQPLMTQQMPVQQMPIQQPQLVPLEVDVIERFGVNQNQMGVNPGAVVNPAVLGQMSNIAGQAVGQMPNIAGQNFTGMVR